MSIKDYEGGIITKNPTTPTGPYQDGVASGVWTMDQAAEYTKQGVWPTAGNVNPEQYVDGLFSTYLYEGNGTSQTITNNLDLDGKGGLVWIKSRPDTYGHRLIDTARGVLKVLESYDTTAEATQAGSLTAFNSNGFDVGNAGHTNFSGNDFVSWSFLKKPGFFDVVTYTGTGSATTISHNLGTVPGVMIIKRTSDVESWQFYHRDFATDEYIQFNSTAASTTVNGTLRWNNTRPTSSVFSIGTHNSVNGSGDTYVAYLFAHDAQLFGDNQNESIIKCGSFTNDAASVGTEVNLGWEPQWLLIKGSSSGSGLGNWLLLDNMRGTSVDSQQYIFTNTSGAEGSSNYFQFTSRGFTPNVEFGGTLIYIAIRRPMKTPEAGTEVFDATELADGSATNRISLSFNSDLGIHKEVDDAADNWHWFSRLTSSQYFLRSNGTNAEFDTTVSNAYAFNDISDAVQNNYISGGPRIFYNFKRATGCFDAVAYTGDGTAGRTVDHNLGVAPELMIVKRRDTTANWQVYASTLGATKYLNLDLTNSAATSSSRWNDTEPTDTVFTTAASGGVNNSGGTFIAYLFATLAGVSKVGSYTGTAASLDIDCGFTAGARFILIKRTDSTGDWYVYDSARGIVAGNDPYLLLNSTAAEVTGTDYIDPLSSGFTVTSSAPTGLNASGGTYIFLAIA